MTDPVTPAAAVPATPAATPEVPPVPPAAPAAAKPDSLIPPADDVTAEVTPLEPTPAKPATAANQSEPEWFLAEGVKGTGKAPEWYKADKYKTVDAQAKAYGELEKRMGAFTGAPKEGKYEFKLPENLEGSLDKEHPLLQGFEKWAAEKQMSQEGFNEVLGMFAEYEASLVPDKAEIKAALGENAEARVQATAAWAKANLDSEQYKALMEATSGPTAPAVFKIVETLIGKTRQVKMPKVGDDITSTVVGGEEAINQMQAKLGPDGKTRLYDSDPKWREHVERTRMDFYAKAQKAA
jgi:hypothetical protein